MSAKRNSAVLGIDIGGSGIKGAPVEVERGMLLEGRLRRPTPRPARPKAVARVIAELVEHFRWSGQIGCAFPAVVEDGVVRTAANIDKSWVGIDGRKLFERRT